MSVRTFPLDFATVEDYTTAGWTVTASGDASLAVDSTSAGPFDFADSANLLRCNFNGTDGEASIVRDIDVVPGQSYTMKVWAKLITAAGFDVGTRLQFRPGPDVSTNSGAWEELSLTHTPSATPISIGVGRFGGFFGVPVNRNSLFAGPIRITGPLALSPSGRAGAPRYGSQGGSMSPGKHEVGPEEAAAMLGLTVEHFLARCCDGNIPGAVLDRDGWRFKRSTIERLRDERGANGSV